MSRVQTNGPRQAPPGSEDFSLDTVSTTSRKLPNRVVVHAQEGWGKTSFAAQAPAPIFLMTKGETGLWTLMDHGQLGPVAHFPRPAETWPEVLLAVQALVVKDHAYRTLVIDTLNGAERLCHEAVCARDFGGDWGERGFLAFHKGYDLAVKDWLELLARLDRLREAKGMSILLLCHTAVQTFRNPEGPDFDRYVPAVHAKTWGATHKWADMVLFGRFEVLTEEKRGQARAKGQGGQTRLLMTTRHAAYDAKNRHGLPEELECGESPQQAWSHFVQALKRPQ